MITPTVVLTRSENVVSAVAGEDRGTMDVEMGTFFALDDIGLLVWEQLATPTAVAELLARIQARYDVSPERCEADVVALLEKMHARGLVGIREEA